MRKVNLFLAFIAVLAFHFLSIGQSEWSEVSPGDLTHVWSSTGKPTVHIKDNAVEITSVGNQLGWLISPGTYEDFHVRLDYKLVGGAEGYVSVRCDHTDALASGYPVHLSNEPEQQNPTGSILNLARATWIDDLNAEGWNRLDIIAIGDHIKVLLNQTKVAETHSRRSRAGQIAIAAKGNAPIHVRSLQVRTFNSISVSGPTIEDRLLSHPNEYESLFDGSSTTGWSEVDEATWKVTDGVIHGYSGKAGGFLCHEKSFYNFHLKAKFKIIKEDNSGIFIRKPMDSTNVSTKVGNSIECNIYDHNGYAHAYSTGSLAPHARAWSNITDYEDWNLADIFAYGDQIVMYVNGIKASEAHLPAFNHSGQVCLQAGIKVFAEDKGPSDIYFKDISIKSID